LFHGGDTIYLSRQFNIYQEKMGFQVKAMLTASSPVIAEQQTLKPAFSIICLFTI